MVFAHYTKDDDPTHFNLGIPNETTMRVRHTFNCVKKRLQHEVRSDRNHQMLYHILRYWSSLTTDTLEL
jgi:hypothetical protein